MIVIIIMIIIKIIIMIIIIMIIMIIMLIITITISLIIVIITDMLLNKMSSLTVGKIHRHNSKTTHLMKNSLGEHRIRFRLDLGIISYLRRASFPSCIIMFVE